MVPTPFWLPSCVVLLVLLEAKGDRDVAMTSGLDYWGFWAQLAAPPSPLPPLPAFHYSNGRRSSQISPSFTILDKSRLTVPKIPSSQEILTKLHSFSHNIHPLGVTTFPVYNTKELLCKVSLLPDRHSRMSLYRFLGYSQHIYNWSWMAVPSQNYRCGTVKSCWKVKLAANQAQWDYLETVMLDK